MGLRCELGQTGGSAHWVFGMQLVLFRSEIRNEGWNAVMQTTVVKRCDPKDSVSDPKSGGGSLWLMTVSSPF